MKGYWLRRNDVLFATQLTPYKVEKLCSECERRGTGKKRQYFIPLQHCTEEYQCKNIPVEEDIGNDVIEQLAANVDFNEGETDSLSKQLKQARLEKIKTDTKLINQKLDQRKKLLFAEWSQKFYEAFSDHFGKLKNCLVNMHLTKEQVDVFNECLQNCLNNLQISLDQIWNDFSNENEQEIKE